MLHKDQTIPGAKIKVRKGPLKDGLPSMYGGGEIIPHLSITASAGSFFNGQISILPGSDLEVVDKPKKRQGINTAIVKDLSNGNVGHVYWCELRINCDHVHPASTLV